MPEIDIKEEESLSAHALRVFQQYHFDYEPRFPSVYVRVLPKNTTQGGIILVDYKQNKPTYEGIVVKVWKPYTIHLKKTDAEGNVVHIERTLVSEFEPGDHIMFAHFVGQPLPPPMPEIGKDNFLYRAIPEAIDQNGKMYVGNDMSCIVPGKLHYERQSLREQFLQIFGNAAETCECGDIRIGALFEILVKEFDLVSKRIECKTTSGV